jgi:hypothetical protein
MKKHFFCIIVIYFSNAFLFAQNDRPPFDYIDLLSYTTREYTYAGMSRYSKISIWGWSRDGKVAYSQLYQVDNRGGTGEEVIIFDLINDVVIYEHRNYSIWASEEEQHIFYEYFKENCLENNIEFVYSELKYIPLVRNNQQYNISIKDIDKNIERRDNRAFSSTVKNYQVIVETQGKNKIIHTGNNRNSKDVFVCGYFKSPFEDRALIIIGEAIEKSESSDFDGSTEFYIVFNFIFVGCHLAVGFN